MKSSARIACEQALWSGKGGEGDKGRERAKRRDYARLAPLADYYSRFFPISERNRLRVKFWFYDFYVTDKERLVDQTEEVLLTL